MGFKLFMVKNDLKNKRYYYLVMKGIIYKVYTKDKTYYGKSTSSLIQRWWGHKSTFNAYKKGKGRNMTVYDLLKEDDVKIELLEEIEIENKCDIKLKEREAYYIKNFECVNKTIPLRTPKEYVKVNKEKIKQYGKEKVICPCCLKSMNKSYFKYNHFLICYK